MGNRTYKSNCRGWLLFTAWAGLLSGPVNLVHGQSPSKTISGAIHKALLDTVARGAPAQPTTVVAIKPAVVLQGFYQEPEVLPEELTFLSAPPNIVDGMLLHAGAGDYVTKLKALASKVQIGKPTLTPAEKASLDAAIVLLRKPDGEPTAVVERYEKSEKSFNELIARQKRAASPAELAEIQSEMNEVKDKWELFGRKSEVESAQALIKEYSDITVREDFVSWKKLLESSTTADASAVWTGFSERGGWLNLESTLESSATSDSRFVSRNPANQIPIPSWKSLSFAVFRARTLRWTPTVGQFWALDKM